jgi:hypothetical protein
LPLAVGLELARSDAGSRVVQIALTNEGSAPVRVEEVALVSPDFAEQDPTPKDSLIPPVQDGTSPCRTARHAVRSAGPA